MQNTEIKTGKFNRFRIGKSFFKLNGYGLSAPLKFVSLLVLILTFSSLAQPIILTGKELPKLLGNSVASIRVLDLRGNAIPFQIDQVTSDGEYVLSQGKNPNTGAGDSAALGPKDEIVFLWNDADIFSDDSPSARDGEEVVILTRGRSKRIVTVRADSSIPLSKKRYIEYDHARSHISTPYYYADFGKDRFHFVKAGVKDFKSGRYVDLTNELRVEILLKAAWGLIPVRYTEDNIVCLVRRYKAGPIRLIRRGDFYLDLGLSMKGSKAAVNQICYPQMVEVPVYVNLPVRFRTFFSHAHIEMTPVLREEARAFKFSVPNEPLLLPVAGNKLDTLYNMVPDGKMHVVSDGSLGYGWFLSTTMNPAHMSASGFLLRRPSSRRGGVAECGFRLSVRDVPKGSYHIINKVVFWGAERKCGSSELTPVFKMIK
ncbi:MAG: hypothetical protein LBI42_15505 [Chitinispirillales bacterium]|jgi:hypothetical protein|nr:hypothetical protein [Chitinispirillales bacterium]